MVSGGRGTKGESGEEGSDDGACIVALMTVGATPAQAGTISIAKGPEGVSRENGFWVTYGASDLAYDDVTNTFILADPGAEITLVGEDTQRCTRAAGKVTCTHVNDRVYYTFELNLGDSDDSAQMDASTGFTPSTATPATMR